MAFHAKKVEITANKVNRKREIRQGMQLLIKESLPAEIPISKIPNIYTFPVTL